MRLMRTLMLVLVVAAPLAAQKDFLTAAEADQVRLVQEPEDRLKLYLKFAEQRMDLLDQLFANKKAGRSGVIHDTLEQLTEIVDAIDTVIDDTLKKRRELVTIEFVAASERQMLARLEKHAAGKPDDLARFEFVLDQAMETLRDSAEMAEEDLKTRTRSVETREAELKKERETMMTPERAEEIKTAEAKKKEEESKQQKKRPSLLRKGETLPAKK